MLAPVVQVDDTIYGDVEAFNIPNLLTDFLATEQAKAGDADDDDDPRKDVVGEARICVCSSCTAGGSFKVYEELKKGRRRHAAAGPGQEGRLQRLLLRDADDRDLGLQPEAVTATASSNRPMSAVSCLKHFRPASWLRRTGANVFHLLENSAHR